MKTARLENKKNLVTKVYRCNYLVEMHSMNSMMASFLKRQSSFSKRILLSCTRFSIRTIQPEYLEGTLMQI